MRLLKAILILNFLSNVSLDFHDNQYIIDFIRDLGYPLLIYDNVTTSDGYILTLFRITRDTSNFKSVVFLMHGLFASGECWFMNKPKNILPFLLADDGHDVWIGNARGTYHSVKHLRYDSGDMRSPYWNFSFHETAVYDQPAMIDFILDLTNCKKLNFVGHSQGTATYFAMAAELPQYSEERISSSFLLGISAFFDNAKGPVRLIAEFLRRYFPGEVEIFGGKVPLENEILFNCCVHDLQQICLWILQVAVGSDLEQIDESLIPLIFRQFPGWLSLKGVFHYVQLADTGNFGQYDYEKEGNLIQYGSVKPPIYNLTKITAPVLLYYTSNDFLAAVEDVMKVHKLIPNSETIYVNYSKFNHVDYIIAKDVDLLVHDSIRKRVAQSDNRCQK